MTEEIEQVVEETVCYGLVDAEGVLINAIIITKDDFETLEKIKNLHNAVNSYPIDQSLYIVQVNKMYWTGTHWDSIVNKP